MKKEYRILWLLAILKFVIPFVLQNHVYEPHRDEFLYLAEAHHMAWGYMEVPPLLSVFAWITNRMGDGIFWIKMWPSLFGALTYWICGRLVLSLGGKSFALLLLLLAFMLGLFLRMDFLFQPNFLEVFFWTLIAYALFRFLKKQDDKWLYLMGIATGLGMLSKYSVSIYATSLLVGILISKNRNMLASKHLYFAGLTALLIFLPTLLWEYRNHFPVMVHMKELQRSQLQYVSPKGFLADQLLMNLPCAFVWIAGLYFSIFEENGKYRIFAWAYLFVILILLYFHGKNYYAAGVYPVLFAFGAFQLERFATHHSRVWKYAFIGVPLCVGIPVIPLGLPVLPPRRLAAYYRMLDIKRTGFLKWEDLQDHPLPQDFADMLGWKEMTRKTAAAYATLTGAEKKNTFIFADNYGQAAAINFYGKRYHLPVVYSDDASFLYWLPDSIHVINILLITDDKNEMQHPFINYFASADLFDSITNPYAREKGSLIILLKGADQKMKDMFREKIAADKNRFIQ